MTSRIVRIFKNWILVISILSGILAYFIAAALPLTIGTKQYLLRAAEDLQPTLLFCMLLVAFCKISPKDMKPRMWHLWLLFIQLIFFGLSTLALWLYPDTIMRFVIEGFMLAMICPTATACAVVTQKLGGDSAATTSYTILICLAVAIVVPFALPLSNPTADITFMECSLAIFKEVFPVLLCPLFLAWLIRWIMPPLHRAIISINDLAFYMWAVNLFLAIAVTTRVLVNTDESAWNVFAIAAATLLACILQFYIGKKIGGRYGMSIEGGQAMGQKNTIFIIWLGYTFLSPISAVAGGFYSIWHNVYNSWQLFEKRESDAEEARKKRDEQEAIQAELDREVERAQESDSIADTKSEATQPTQMPDNTADTEVEKTQTRQEAE
jgi:BASS family bile acid:Na+ symporter